MSGRVLKPARITATDIRSGMLKRWAQPEYAVMWEVANGTGYNVRRWADAIIMSLWPSRGLELHGVEIKVSRADWKREALDPQKAEEVGQFCDRWWVHTSPGVVDDLSDMPPAWGLREFDGKSWVTRKEAEKTEAKPITHLFLAAMLRRADNTMRAMIEEARREAERGLQGQAEQREAGFAARVEAAVQRKTGYIEEAIKNVTEFEAAFGSGSARDFAIRHARLGRAARAVHDAHVGDFTQNLAQRFRKAADELDAIAALTAVEDAA